MAGRNGCQVEKKVSWENQHRCKPQIYRNKMGGVSSWTVSIAKNCHNYL